MLILSNENLPVSERIPWWNEVVCDYASKLNTSIGIAGKDIPHFKGKLVGHDVGILGMFDITIQEPQYLHISRDLRNTRRADDEFVLLNLQLTGSNTFEQAGRTAFMKPGAMALYDSRLPHNGIMENNANSLLLRIPHDDLICRIPHLADIAAVVFDPAKTITRLAYEMVRSLNKQLPTGDREHDTILTDATLDTITAAALSNFRGQDANCSSGSAALLWRVKSYIDLHLLDSNLSPEQIASAHSVTVRYLNLLFAREDSSITRWINKRRLEKCGEMLRSSRHMNHNVNDVAYNCGFGNLSYFYFRFKQHYGCTPLEYRLNASIPGRERPYRTERAF